MNEPKDITKRELLERLINNVRDMRDAQKCYFKTKGRISLEASKKFEALVDADLDKIDFIKQFN